ncbi:hypothetical protein BDV11DRAFT_33084 [Aspergillus similis]
MRFELAVKLFCSGNIWARVALVYVLTFVNLVLLHKKAIGLTIEFLLRRYILGNCCLFSHVANTFALPEILLL